MIAHETNRRRKRVARKVKLLDWVVHRMIAVMNVSRCQLTSPIKVEHEAKNDTAQAMRRIHSKHSVRRK